MGNKAEIWAWIPARANSKRLPNKNLLHLSNKPLIQWTIDASLDCKDISKTFVFTDSEKIKELAVKSGALCPFLRGSENAQDNSATADALKEFLLKIKKTDTLPEYLVILQPTSPLRNNEHIYEAIKVLKEKNADAVVSVSPSPKPPHWMNSLPKDHSLLNFIKPEFANVRSQDIPQYYFLNGAIYILNVQEFLKQKNIYLNKNIFAYIMDYKSGIDIDTLEDLELAEYYSKK